MESEGLCGELLRESVVSDTTRVVEHQPKGEGRLVMGAKTDGVRQLRQPIEDLLDNRILERTQRFTPLVQLWIVALFQFKDQLEVPRDAVWSLE